MIDFIVSINDRSDELDCRQVWKIHYPLSTILFLGFIFQLAGIETWKGMEDYAEMNADSLGDYVDLSDGCPSHDTLEGVVDFVNPDCLQQLKLHFEQSIAPLSDLQRLIAIDGKTIRGNQSQTQDPTHIVTAYDGTNRLSIGQIETRDYWISYDGKWLQERHAHWQKLRAIGMTYSARSLVSGKSSLAVRCCLYLTKHKNGVII